VKQRRQTPFRRPAGFYFAAEAFDDQGVLRNVERKRSQSLTVPAGNSRQPMCNVVDFNINRGGVQKIEPAAGKHALPGARRID